MLKKIVDKKIIIIVSIFLLIFLINIFYNLVIQRKFFYLYQPRNYSEISYLDIGQGDATLIQTNQYKNILIDGGPDLSLIYQLGKVLPFYEKHIDLMILTHPDQDHMYGLIEVLKRYQVDELWLNGIDDQTADYLYFLSVANDYNVPIKIVQAGKELIIDNLKLSVFYPFESLQNKKIDDTNESSLVIRVDYYHNSFLFTGDLPINKELELVKKNIDLKVDVLKAGHHGSKTSSSLKFLQKTKPFYVIISAGKNNRFGHPHFRVLKNISKIGAKVLRTDQMGNIQLITDGKDILRVE